MTGSRSRAARRGGLCGLSLLCLLALPLLGCRSQAALPANDSLLDPLARRVPRPPSEADRLAAELAGAALATNRPEMERLLAALQALGEDAHDSNQPDQPDDEMDGLDGLDVTSDIETIIPLAIDLVNSTLDDPISYRKASEELLDEEDPDPLLEQRLEMAVDDDPLRLARKRRNDNLQVLFAHSFNAVSRTIGQSAVTGGAAAPYTIAMAAVHWLAGLYERDSFSLQERQALAHRKRFVAAHPDAPEVEDVVGKIERGNQRYAKLQRERLVRAGNRALDRGDPRLAIALSQRALAHVPQDEAAADLRAQAVALVDRERTLRAAGLAAAPELPDDLTLLTGTSLAAIHSDGLAPLSHAHLAERLMNPSADLRETARELLELADRGELADEAEFVMALAQFEAGNESASWRRLARLARGDPETSNMARHAAALVSNPWQNPYGSFERLQSRGRSRFVAWRFLGPWATRPRYRKLPRALSYLVDAPSMAQSIITAPLRVVMSWRQPTPDFKAGAATAAYRYLGVHPDGEHTRDLVDWLYDYEKERKRWSAALRLADFQPGFDVQERNELVEQAAGQQIQQAQYIERRDLRGMFLQNVTRDFPDSAAGHLAGVRVRGEADSASEQRIRLTRGFLEENPGIVGPHGLGMRAALLDGDVRNGELHPEGVTFLGSRVLEFAFVAEGRDEEDPPHHVRRKISSERLARVVNMLEESAYVNVRVDSDDSVAPDAQRDHYFERARLGLAEQIDPRATAQSNYVYEGMRERYGMVRARDSVLPFDLVITGSVTDLRLGAFPRWRPPRETPDAFLYR